MCILLQKLVMMMCNALLSCFNVFIYLNLKLSDGEFSVRTHLPSLRQSEELRWFLSYVHFTLNQIKLQPQKEPKYISDWNDLLLLTSFVANTLQQYAWICEILMESEQVFFALLRLAILIKCNSQERSKFIFYFMFIQIWLIWFDMLLLDCLLYFTIHINCVCVCVVCLLCSSCHFAGFVIGKMTDNWRDIT